MNKVPKVIQKEIQVTNLLSELLDFQKKQQQRKGNKRKARGQAKVTSADVNKPQQKDGFQVQPSGKKQVLSAWDQMIVAKNFPGQFNPPYVAGMNVTSLPTNSFSVSNALSDSNIYGQSTDSPLGTAPYTLIMWCSSLTAFYGQGGAGQVPSSDKVGGFVIKQVQAADLETNWITRNSFQEIQSSHTMVETYGSDMTGFAAGGFVWASEATFNILTPAATLVGSYYRGTVTYGQLPRQGSTGLSLQNLIEISGDAEVMQPSFHLRTAVNNNDLVYSSQQSVNDNPDENDFVGELVNYIVLQEVAKNITTGANATYGLQFNIRGNGVFWGNPRDAIANNLFKTSKSKDSPLPAALEGVQQNPDIKTPAVGSLFDGAKYLLSKAWENRDLLMPIVSSVAGLLLEPSPQENELLVVRTNYLAQIENSISSLLNLQTSDPTLKLDLTLKTLQARRLKVVQTSGRLFPLEEKEYPHETCVKRK